MEKLTEFIINGPEYHGQDFHRHIIIHAKVHSMKVMCAIIWSNEVVLVSAKPPFTVSLGERQNSTVHRGAR